MRRTLLLFFLLPVLFFAACKKVPDHARYIPKSALSVVGINTASVGKKLSSQAAGGPDMMRSLDSFAQRKGYALQTEDLRNSGIDLSSTTFIYFASTGNLSAGSYNPETVAIVPVDNAGKWEAFLKKVFPRLQPLTATGGKAAQLDSNYAALWTEKVAFLSNVKKTPGGYTTLPDSTEEWQEGQPDLPATLAALEALPKLSKEESIVEDKRFATLAKSGRDLSFWLNYEQMMSGLGGMSAMTALMGGKLYKNTAMAATVDFKDGKAEAEAQYYISEELKEVSRKMASGSLPKDMIERLPKENLDGFMTLSLSLEGFKTMLDKMGMVGLFNMALAAQGLSIDDITEAFTGDMVASINNFKTISATADTTYGRSNSSVPTMDYVVALKLGKAEKVDKLMKFMLNRKLLSQLAPNVYAPFGSTGDNGVVVLDKTYAVAAKNAGIAQAYLSGAAPKNLPDAARQAVTGDPMNLFVDFQQFMKGINPAQIPQERDRQTLLESQKLFSYATMGGGKLSGDHINYSGRLELVNQKENALVQLLRFANRVHQIDEAYKMQHTSPAGVEILDTAAAPVPNAAL